VRIPRSLFCLPSPRCLQHILPASPQHFALACFALPCTNNNRFVVPLSFSLSPPCTEKAPSANWVSEHSHAHALGSSKIESLRAVALSPNDRNPPPPSRAVRRFRALRFCDFASLTATRGNDTGNLQVIPAPISYLSTYSPPCIAASCALDVLTPRSLLVTARDVFRNTITRGSEDAAFSLSLFDAERCWVSPSQREAAA